MFKIIILIIASLLILTGCSNNTEENIDSENIGSMRATAEINISKENGTNIIESKQNQIEQSIPKEPVETNLSEFSTKLLSRTDSRLNNIRITCNTINGTTIHVGESFSFNSIVGKSTTSNGYQEADVIINGEKKQGLGGGNCQVSSTIYNAVLQTSGLVVTERHPHGKPVAYVEKDHDAAISYGSMDLKFRNDTGYDIKLYVSSDDSYVSVRIVRIS